MNVIVSRAEEPALALLEDRLVQIIGPEFERVDHRGAGDSMTAAIAAALARQQDIETALRLGAAAGALNTTRHGLATGERDRTISPWSSLTSQYSPDSGCRNRGSAGGCYTTSFASGPTSMPESS